MCKFGMTVLFVMYELLDILIACILGVATGAKKQPAKKEKQKSPHCSLFIPKDGKEMIEENLKKKEKTRSRNQI